MSAMNAPLVMPIMTAARKRSIALPPYNENGAGDRIAPASRPDSVTTPEPLLGRELLDEGPGAALADRARELRQRGVAVRVERPLAENAVVVLGAHDIGHDRRAVIGLVARLGDRREDDLARLVAVDRVRVRVVVVELGVVVLQPFGGLAGVLLRRHAAEGGVDTLTSGASLLQELGAVDAVRSHELHRRRDSLEVLDEDRGVVVDDAAVVDEVRAAVLDLVRKRAIVVGLLCASVAGLG